MQGRGKWGVGPTVYSDSERINENAVGTQQYSRFRFIFYWKKKIFSPSILVKLISWSPYFQNHIKSSPR